MAHNNHDEGLPATWPFRAAGTVMIATLVWFCLGMGLHDVGEELPNHMPVFYLGILATIVFVLGGAIYNSALERGRRQHG